MKKVLGIFGLLVFVCLFTTILNPDFVTPYNIQNTLRWTSLYGIISIGVAFVIITGGIDLSIGSLVGLIGCALPMCISALDRDGFGDTIRWTLMGTGIAATVLVILWAATHWSERGGKAGRKALLGGGLGIITAVAGYFLPSVSLPPAAGITVVVLWMIEIAVFVGLWHGMLITQVRLQPFIVTLCGLLFYRGFARWMSDDQTQGFGTGYLGLRSLAIGRPCTMAFLLFVFAVCILLWCAWRWLRERGQRLEDPIVSPICVMFAAAILAIACSLQWFEDFDAIRALESQGTVAVTRTQWLLAGVGGISAVVGVIALTIFAVLRKKWLVLAALAVGIVGGIMLQGVFYMDANELWIVEQQVVEGEEITTTTIDSTAFRVPLAVVGLFASMGGASWFLAVCWRNASLAGRSAVFLTIVAGVYYLAGLTPIDRVQVPTPFLIMSVVAVLAGMFLNFTVYGRYLLALGNNEEAARYSGINTKAMIMMAYVICAMMAGIAGVLFALDINSIQPSSHGNFYELYAIAAAVLGGCSLRGGEGSILGVVIGAAVMRVLYNAINMLGIPTQLEFAIIGAVILVGVVVDEIFKHLAERRSRATIAKSR